MTARTADARIACVLHHRIALLCERDEADALLVKGELADSESFEISDSNEFAAFGMSYGKLA